MTQKKLTALFTALILIPHLSFAMDVLTLKPGDVVELTQDTALYALDVAQHERDEYLIQFVAKEMLFNLMGSLGTPGALTKRPFTAGTQLVVDQAYSSLEATGDPSDIINVVVIFKYNGYRYALMNSSTVHLLSHYGPPLSKEDEAAMVKENNARLKEKISRLKEAKELRRP